MKNANIKEPDISGDLKINVHNEYRLKDCVCLMWRVHPLFKKATGLTELIIGAAIEVHRDKGPGLMESVYQWCLEKELGLRQLECVSQKSVLIRYKGFTREEPLRFDLLVEGCVLLEAKAVQAVLPIHKAQLLSYMKLLDVPLGLLINFHEMKVTDGISRMILPGANVGQETGTSLTRGNRRNGEQGGVKSS